MADKGVETKLKSAFDVLMGKEYLAIGSRYSEDSDFEGSDYEGSIYSELASYMEGWEVPHHMDRKLRGEQIDEDISYEEFRERFWWQCGFGPRQMEEESFEEYWSARSWTRLNKPDIRRERWYILRQSRARRIPHRIHYEFCTPEELKRFVQQRGLKDPFPHGITLKYLYIALLKQADRERKFAFMDLPPEMRLMVYRNLLGISMCDYRGKAAQVAILRISKEVYEEARNILYDDNTFLVSFNVVVQANARIFKSSTVHGSCRSAGCDHAPRYRVPEGLDDYPAFMRQIAHLQIGLRLDSWGACSMENIFPLHQYLYTLASFFMDGHRLKSIHLELHLPSDMDDPLYEKLLYPLRRLRNITTITFEGPIPAHVQKKLESDLTSVEPVFNTMKNWKLLKEEAIVQMNLLEAVTDEGRCTCGECPVSDCVETLQVRLGALEAAKKDACLSSTLEENFIARLGYLRNALRSLDIDAVKQLVKDVIEKRLATTKYENVSDDGRLAEAAMIWEGKVYDDDLKYGDPAETRDDWKDEHQMPQPSHADTELEPASATASPELL